MNGPAEEIGVACVQLSPERDDPDGNLERSLAWIHSAAGAGHELIVLPELAVSGYAFADRAEAWASGEGVPDGFTCRAWRQAAREHGVWVVGGVAERAWGALYDTAVLIGPDGEVLSVYRKMHLWSTEHLWFEPGGNPSGIVNLPFGRVALAICFDLWVAGAVPLLRAGGRGHRLRAEQLLLAAAGCAAATGRSSTTWRSPPRT